MLNLALRHRQLLAPGAAYKSNSEAMTACAALNGSQFEGVTLQVEMWGRKA